eukprot:7180865-Prymnesium_polylepis.1
MDARGEGVSSWSRNAYVVLAPGTEQSTRVVGTDAHARNANDQSILAKTKRQDSSRDASSRTHPARTASRFDDRL